MLRRVAISLLLVVGVLGLAPTDRAAASAGQPVVLTLFYGDGCPHCHAELELSLIHISEPTRPTT